MIDARRCSRRSFDLTLMGAVSLTGMLNRAGRSYRISTRPVEADIDAAPGDVS
jgi:hypothetical protein